MSFFSVALRSLFRRRIRTGLTLLGIALGIAAVVALVGLSEGFQKSWEKGLKARGTDIVVSNMGSSLTPRPFSAEVRERLATLPQISSTSALLVELTSIENSQMMMLSAREWNSFTWQKMKVLDGRLPRDEKESAVVLGRSAAESLGKKVGDTVQIEAAELKVVGIIDGGAIVEDGSVILALPVLQEILGEQGKINVIDVHARQPATEADLAKLCSEINKLVPECRALIASENLSNSQGYRMIQAMSWGTSLLAVLVGVFGVMNTMLMAVFERRQEISILLAIGWKRSRIVSMILLESAILGFLGGAIGVACGAIGVQFLQSTPALRGLLEADLSIGLFLTSLAMAALIGVLSGLYPAWRSSRLNPSAALQG